MYNKLQYSPEDLLSMFRPSSEPHWEDNDGIERVTSHSCSIPLSLIDPMKEREVVPIEFVPQPKKERRKTLIIERPQSILDSIKIEPPSKDKLICANDYGDDDFYNKSFGDSNNRFPRDRSSSLNTERLSLNLLEQNYKFITTNPKFLSEYSDEVYSKPLPFIRPGMIKNDRAPMMGILPLPNVNARARIPEKQEESDDFLPFHLLLSSNRATLV